MGLLSARFIQREIARTGNTVTIIEVSRSTGSDEYRAITETPTSNTGISCFVQILSETDEPVKYGKARAGDFIFWFDSDQESKCLQGNRITFDSKTFQIIEARKFDISGITYLIECRTKQI